MKTQIQEKINITVKAKARELAEKEGRGYIEAEWLQAQLVETEKSIHNFIGDAEKKGYTVDDLDVKPYISTHSAWYSWFAYEIIHPILGKVNSQKIEFPQRSTHHKNFIEPLYQKELIEQNKQKVAKLESTIAHLREENRELRYQLVPEEEED